MITKKLHYAMVTRFFLTILLLYYFNIPLYMKLILIAISDKVDCSHLSFPYRGPLLFKNTNICKTQYYQLYDKIVDTIVHFITLHYILTTNPFNKREQRILVRLLFFRLIGVVGFIFSANEKFLFYFPDYFREFTIFYAITKHFKISKKYKDIVFYSIIFLKPVQEYLMHYK